MKIAQILQNMIGDSALANRNTVEIPMEIAVKIAFALGSLGQIITITEDATKHKYTELDKRNENSSGE